MKSSQQRTKIEEIRHNYAMVKKDIQLVQGDLGQVEEHGLS